jgi:hypothetical protein
MKTEILKIKEGHLSLFDPPITNKYPIDTITLVQVLELIKIAYKGITASLRAISDSNLQGGFKRNKLPYVTFSGKFSSRNDKSLEKHSGLMCIDVDHLAPDELIRVKSFVNSDFSHTLGSFTSPSGNGLKVVYAIDPEVHSQKEWYGALSKYVSTSCNLPVSKVDASCSNVSRACFLCHDPELFVNPALMSDDPSATIDILDIQLYLPGEPSKSNPGLSTRPVVVPEMDSLRYAKPNFENKSAEGNFRYLLHLQIRKEGEYKSPREPWIQKLASRCNLFGMEEAATLGFILKYFEHHPESVRADKPIDVEKYLIAPVKDVYKRYKDQFDTWSDFNAEDEPTPVIDESVFESLPPLLQRLCIEFTSVRERDIALLGSLGVLSSCFPSVTGIYDGKKITSNLNVFVTAPASAGKGALMFARYLGATFQDKLREQYRDDMKEYELLLNEAKSGGGELPQKPTLKKFFIPANSSSIKLIECLYANKDFGVMFDSEADTLSQTFKNEWGNFSDIIRKAFHHEPIEVQRKLNDQYIQIESSYLSIVLSGTPNQVGNLLTNIENGVFSRFLFYSFPLSKKWKNVFEENNSHTDLVFKSASIEIYDFHSRLKQFAISRQQPEFYQAIFKLLPDQEQRFNEFFESRQDMLFDLYGADIMASIRRLGLIAFRIAMILSTLRLINHPEKAAERIVCEEADFKNTLKIVEVALHHAVKVYNQLKKKQRFKHGDKKVKFFEKLPAEFNRNKMLEIASFMELNPKTAEKYVSDYISQSLLKRAEHNHYVKIA